MTIIDPKMQPGYQRGGGSAQQDTRIKIGSNFGAKAMEPEGPAHKHPRYVQGVTCVNVVKLPQKERDELMAKAMKPLESRINPDELDPLEDMISFANDYPDRYVFIVAKMPDGDVAGAFLGMVLPGEEGKKSYFFIHNIAVDKKYAFKGVDRELAKQVEIEINEHNQKLVDDGKPPISFLLTEVSIGRGEDIDPEGHILTLNTAIKKGTFPIMVDGKMLQYLQPDLEGSEDPKPGPGGGDEAIPMALLVSPMTPEARASNTLTVNEVREIYSALYEDSYSAIDETPRAHLNRVIAAANAHLDEVERAGRPITYGKPTKEEIRSILKAEYFGTPFSLEEFWKMKVPG
jgi:hypothetical protein